MNVLLTKMKIAAILRLLQLNVEPLKKALINRRGGKCEKCGYDKYMRALEFHHLDPMEKDFGISRTLTKSMATLIAETDKCILLCSNCHAEEHQKLFDLGYSQFNPDI